VYFLIYGDLKKGGANQEREGPGGRGQYHLFFIGRRGSLKTAIYAIQQVRQPPAWFARMGVAELTASKRNTYLFVP
jgi:hypothetical protein